MVIAFEAATANPEGTTYVRFLDENGGEVAYWIHTEWEEQSIEVMGAICGAMLSKDKATQPEKFYQFAKDCEFPEGIEFERWEE